MMVAENETIRSFLARRKTELTNRKAALESSIAAIQAELDEISKAEAALGPDTVDAIGVLNQLGGSYLINSPLALAAIAIGSPDVATVSGAQHEVVADNPLSPSPNPLSPSPDPLLPGGLAQATIKELVLMALRASVPHYSSGMTVSEIRGFIWQAYGRDIDRTSLSPQLSRLRDDGLIELCGDGLWRLLSRRSRRGSVLYDHPRSHKK